LPPMPSFRRWPFEILLRRLTRKEPLARIVVLRGPRQIGKTTLQYQIIEHMLKNGVAASRIARVQFDDLPSFSELHQREPILDIAAWFEAKILGKTFNAASRDGTPAFLFLDEVQNIPNWDVQLKAFIDRTDVRVLVTGSSALRIERGRDSLAGRIQTLEIGPFRLAEIASVRGFGDLPRFAEPNGIGDWSRAEFLRGLADHGLKHAKLREIAFAAFSERGGYPLAQRADVEWPEVADQLNETVIRRVIQHDLRVGERGRRRDAQLLEELFRMTARYCGQSPSLVKLAAEAHETLEANVGTQRIRQYIEFLDSSLLVRAIQPHEMRLKKKRGAPKYCLSDHALRAAWLSEIVPLTSDGLRAAPELSDLAGRIAESVAGYFFASIGVPVTYLPATPQNREVDFILTAGDHRIPVEIKYQTSPDPVRDVAALEQFMAKKSNRAPIGILVTRDDAGGNFGPNIIALPLKSLLLAH
jgi:predicted AAA+ superfamily ATPase